MKKDFFVLLILITVAFSGCNSGNQTSKYGFEDGYYTISSPEITTKVYVDNSEDSISVYQVKMKDDTSYIDTSQAKLISLPQQKSPAKIQQVNFFQSYIDIDFMAIPFKYRPSVSSMPSQFNSNLNGAIYLGYRLDLYQLWYKKSIMCCLPIIT